MPGLGRVTGTASFGRLDFPLLGGLALVVVEIKLETGAGEDIAQEDDEEAGNGVGGDHGWLW